MKFKCLIAPLRDGNTALQRHYENGLRHFETLHMSETVYLTAAQLRARFGLKIPDTLHLATAQHHACTALWTNDDRLARASHGLVRNLFKQG